jgi:hypothetical protein
LFESVVSDVVIDDVKWFKSLSEVFGNVEQTLISYLAAVELEMLQVGVAFEKLVKQVFV